MTKHQADRSALRVLFLEDDAIIAFRHEATLAAMGFGDVVVAGSLEQAQKAIDEAPIDLAVLDLNIRGLSSLEIGRSIERQGGKAILATGSNPDQCAQSAFSGPVLAKPYDAEELRSAIETALN